MPSHPDRVRRHYVLTCCTCVVITGGQLVPTSAGCPVHPTPGAARPADASDPDPRDGTDQPQRDTSSFSSSTTDTGFTVNVIEGEPDYFWGV